jgi:2'-hydroxyisoflavone reductase
MRLLVIGGTKFLGRYLIESALARGHEVTMFNRGARDAALFPEIERLRGDRNRDLSALAGRRWDAVIDTCGYTPGVVGRAAALLSERVAHYTFISSLSVYKDFSAPAPDESRPVATITDEQLRAAEASEPTADGVPAQAYGAAYGPLKALCEQALENALPGRALSVRAGMIVGPHDYTDRFTYWARRMARGGEVLAPAPAEQRTQLVDARDLSDWLVRMSEERRTGTFNATGPDYPLTFERMLDECRRAGGSDARVTWADEKFLLNAGVGPWVELPFWMPDVPDEGEAEGLNRYFFHVNCQKAIASGLKFRPLIETARDTLAWDRTRPQDAPLKAGLNAEREAELLYWWRAQSSRPPLA